MSSWYTRTDAVDILREGLGLITSQKEENPENSLGIVSLSATSLEARYVRLEWENGRVGQFKLTDYGTVERAVILGNDNRRDKATENALTGGDGRVEGVLDRLRSLF